MDVPRRILHLDMNAFYASCHQTAEPEKYRGKPICVGGRKQENSIREPIIVTASYEARAYHPSIRAGMTVQKALELCPDLIVVEPDFDLYRAYSMEVKNICDEWSPVVEPASIDEMYLDVTGMERHGGALRIAHGLKRTVHERLGMTCSVGVADSKLLAKQASEYRKPNAVTEMYREDVPAMLWSLSVDSLYGCGAKTTEKLRRLRIFTIGELANTDPAMLIRFFGVKAGRYLHEAANGINDSPVDPESARMVKSIGHSTTLPQDEDNSSVIRSVLLHLADQVGRRIRHLGYKGRTITLQIRDAKFKTITRSTTLRQFTDDENELFLEAWQLFQIHWEDGRKVRLLGLAVTNLRMGNAADEMLPQQLSLDFSDGSVPNKTAWHDMVQTAQQPGNNSSKQTLTKVVDTIRDRYGEQAVVKASMLAQTGSELLDRKGRGTSLEKDIWRSK